MQLYSASTLPPHFDTVAVAIAQHTVRYGIVLAVHFHLQDLTLSFIAVHSVLCSECPHMLNVCVTMAAWVMFEVDSREVAFQCQSCTQRPLLDSEQEVKIAMFLLSVCGGGILFLWWG